MKNTTLILLLLCTPSIAKAAFPITVKGDIGQPILLNKVPKRVVAIGAENVEMLAVMGIKPVGFALLEAKYSLGEKPDTAVRILGHSVLSDAEFVGLSRQPSLENIIRLKPDLVLTYGSTAAPEPYQALSGKVPTLAYDFDTDHTWRQPLGELATVFGKQNEVKDYLQKYDANVRQLKTKMSTVILKSPRTTFIYMPDASRIMLLGRKFAFGKALTALGLKIDTPTGIDPNMMAIPITPEALLGYKHQRIVILGLEGYNNNKQASTAFEQFRKQGVAIFVYKMPENQPYSGPMTDLKRIQDMAELITR